jgi:hypothetical protein
MGFAALNPSCSLRGSADDMTMRELSKSTQYFQRETCRFFSHFGDMRSAGASRGSDSLTRT